MFFGDTPNDKALNPGLKWLFQPPIDAVDLHGVSDYLAGTEGKLLNHRLTVSMIGRKVKRPNGALSASVRLLDGVYQCVYLHLFNQELATCEYLKGKKVVVRGVYEPVKRQMRHQGVFDDALINNGHICQYQGLNLWTQNEIQALLKTKDDRFKRIEERVYTQWRITGSEFNERFGVALLELMRGLHLPVDMATLHQSLEIAKAYNDEARQQGLESEWMFKL